MAETSITGQAKNALLRQHEIIANNLANTGTIGFKRDTVAFHQVLDEENQESLTPIMKMDTKSGGYRQTGNLFDMAIQGKGYFSVQTPNGVFYTRNGSFRIDNSGLLVDQQGNPVQSEGGAIAIDPALEGDLKVSAEGQLFIGNAPLGRLLVSDFSEDSHLKKIGSNLFEFVSGEKKEIVGGESSDAAFQVLQGYLESSTVNPVQEMTEMLEALRLFEANQRAGQVQDEALGKAIRELR